MMSAAVLAVSAIGFSSCTEEKYYIEGENGTASMTVDEIEVFPSKWAWNSAYKRYEAKFDADKIDKRLLEKGTILAGMYQEERAVWKLKYLPYIIAVEQDITQMFNYDVSEGKVTFYLQYSDMAAAGSPNEAITFRLSLFWDEYEK